MSLDILPADLLLDLPQYLHSIEDLCSLFSTCRTLYRTCGDPSPKTTLRLAASSGRVFFRPHPHLLIAATARQVADWAVESDDRRYRLEVAIQGGVNKLLELAIDVAELSMADIRRLYAYKCDVLNPLNRRLDTGAGPASDQPMTVCNDPETTLLSWVIYGELFHHSLELAYLPLPQHKPLNSIIRYKWFVYCMPDVNSFNYMKFSANEIPQFFKEYVQQDDDRFQQLSMSEATRNFLDPPLWEKELGTSPSFRTANPALRELFIACAMHMGMKSLELVVPGGVQKLEADLARIANGIRGLSSGIPSVPGYGYADFNDEDDEEDSDSEDQNHATVELGTANAEEAFETLAARAKRLLEFVGDPWLCTAYPTLRSDMSFTLWSNWEGEEDDDPLMEAIRNAPQKTGNSLV